MEGNVTQLARRVTSFIAPFLPYLLDLVENAAKAAGERFGEPFWEQAKALWDKLGAKEEAREAAKQAAEGMLIQSGDEDALASLRLQIEELLEANTALRQEVAQLWEEIKAARDTVAEQTAGGDRITVGDITDSEGVAIGPGAQAKVTKIDQRGKYITNIEKAENVHIGDQYQGDVSDEDEDEVSKA